MVQSGCRRDDLIDSIYASIDRLQLQLYATMVPRASATLDQLHAAAASSDPQDLMAFISVYSEENRYTLISFLNRKHIEKGMTALHVAIQANSEDNVDMLMSHGAEVGMTNNDGLNMVHFAVALNNKPMLELILRKSIKNFSDRYGFSHLHGAALLDDPLLIEKYINLDGNINKMMYPPPIRSKKENNKLEIWPVRTRNIWHKTELVYDLTSVHNHPFALYTPLQLAVEHGNVQAVKALLLQQNIEVNFQEWRGFSALHLACALADEHIATILVEMLLIKGADVASRTNSGATPLHVATYMGYDEIVMLLLLYGADANVWENWDNVTPLHLAARNLMADTVHLLLAFGADGRRKDKKKRTALHWMVTRDPWCYDINSSIEIKKNKEVTCMLYDITIQWLLAGDCDINAQDLWGRTAMHMAIKCHNACAAQRLQRWGPDLEIYDYQYNTVKDYDKWKTMWCTTCLSMHSAFSVKMEN